MYDYSGMSDWEFDDSLSDYASPTSAEALAWSAEAQRRWGGRQWGSGTGDQTISPVPDDLTSDQQFDDPFDPPTDYDVSFDEDPFIDPPDDSSDYFDSGDWLEDAGHLSPVPDDLTSDFFRDPFIDPPADSDGLFDDPFVDFEPFTFTIYGTGTHGTTSTTGTGTGTGPGTGTGTGTHTGYTPNQNTGGNTMSTTRNIWDRTTLDQPPPGTLYGWTGPEVDDGSDTRTPQLGAAHAYDAAQAAANQSNEARYREILGGYQTRQGILAPEIEQMPGHYASREQHIMGEMSGLGRAARADLNRRYDQEAGNVEQSLIDRGLGNTTVLGSMTRGVRDQQARAMHSLNEQLRRERLGYRTALSGDTLGSMERSIDARSNLYREPLDFMERREDLGPDTAYLNAAMATAYGSGTEAGYGLPWNYSSGAGMSSIGARRTALGLDDGGSGERESWLGGTSTRNVGDSDQLVDQDYPKLDESGDGSAGAFDPLTAEEGYLRSNPGAKFTDILDWRTSYRDSNPDADWSKWESPEQEHIKEEFPELWEKGYRTMQEVDKKKAY